MALNGQTEPAGSACGRHSTWAALQTPSHSCCCRAQLKSFFASKHAILEAVDGTSRRLAVGIRGLAVLQQDPWSLLTGTMLKLVRYTNQLLIADCATYDLVHSTLA